MVMARVGRRARKVYGLLRDLVIGQSKQHIVRAQEPVVTLTELTSLQPTPSLLDYAVSDNRILGCVNAYLIAQPDLDIRFLTHDAGAMATARNQNIPFVPVPDDWRRPPPSTATERRLADLEAENTRLRAAEPQLNVQFFSSDQEKIDSIVGQGVLARSLSEHEVSELVNRLESGFPHSHNRNWLDECEELFRNLHISLQRQAERVSVWIGIKNQGTRPRN